MAEVGKANIRITADDKQARKTVSGFFGFLKKTGGVAAGIAGGLAVFEGVKNTFSGLYTATIGANATMEQYRNTLKTVLGTWERADKTLAWVKTFAKETPFEIPELVEATTRLSAYGITAQDVLQDIGDMASVMGKPLMQAVEAVADAQTGELERLKEFGITKQMLIDQAAKMGYNEVVNAKGQIVDMEKFNEALFALMEERYSGGMKMQSKTFRGMISNAKDSMGQIATILSEPIFDRLKNGLAAMLPVFDGALAYVEGDMQRFTKTMDETFGPGASNKIMAFMDVIQAGWERIKQFGVDMLPVFQVGFQSFMNIMPLLGDVFTIAAAGLAALMKVLPPLLEELMGIVEVITGWEYFIPIVEGLAVAFISLKVAQTAAKWIKGFQLAITIMANPLTRAIALTGLWQKAMLLLNASFLLNPITLTIAAIAALGTALYSLYKHNDKFKKFVDGIGRSIKETFQDDMQDFKKGAEVAGKSLDTLGGKIQTQFKKDVSDLKKWFGQDLPAAWDKFRGAVEEKGVPIAEKMEGWRVSIQGFFEQVKTDLPGMLSGWGSSIDGWLQAQDEENKRQFGEWWETISSWFTSLPGRTRTKLSEWGQSISSWFKETKNTWSNNLESWWGSISAWFTSLPSRTGAKLTEWGTSIRNWMIQKKNDWTTNLNGWWTTISAWFTGMPGKTKVKLDEWWASIKSWMTNTKKNWTNALNDWWQSIKTWFTSLQNKPEVKNSGNQIVNKVAQGAEEKKADWSKRLGKLIIDGIGYMLAAALIVIFAAGRELITRMADGIKSVSNKIDQRWDAINTAAKKKMGQLATDLYNEGKKLPGKIADGIKAMASKVDSGAAAIGKRIMGQVREDMNDIIDGINWVLGKLGVSKGKQVPRFPAYAKGTKGHPGGPAIVGEKGRELADIPGQGITLLGQRGPEFLNLPKGTSVLPNKKTEKLLKSLYPGYAGGVGNFFKGLLDKALDIWDYIDKPSKLMKKVWNTMGIKDLSGAGSFADVARGGIGKVKDSAIGFVKDKMSDFAAFFGGSAPNISGGAAAWKPAIIAAAKRMGEALSGRELNGIIAQIQRESGGNQRIVQSSKVVDVNTLAGNPARGLLQYIPQTFRAYALKGSQDIYNGMHQLLAFFNNTNWRRDLPYGKRGWGPTGARKFAKGGFFLHGPELGLFGEAGPEMALPLIGRNMRPYALAVAQNLADLMGGNFGGGAQHNHYWNVNADEINDVQKLINMINGVTQAVNAR